MLSIMVPIKIGRKYMVPTNHFSVDDVDEYLCCHLSTMPKLGQRMSLKICASLIVRIPIHGNPIHITRGRALLLSVIVPAIGVNQTSPLINKYGTEIEVAIKDAADALIICRNSRTKLTKGCNKCLPEVTNHKGLASA